LDFGFLPFVYFDLYTGFFMGQLKTCMNNIVHPIVWD